MLKMVITLAASPEAQGIHSHALKTVELTFSGDVPVDTGLAGREFLQTMIARISDRCANLVLRPKPTASIDHYFLQDMEVIQSLASP